MSRRKCIPANSRASKLLSTLNLRQPIATTICVVADVILVWGSSDDYEMSPQMNAY